MSRNSPSARYHRAIVYLAHLAQYKKYGPLIGPKEKHQPNPRWEKKMINKNFVLGMSIKTDLSVEVCQELLEKGWTYKESLTEPGTWVAPISSLRIDSSALKLPCQSPAPIATNGAIYIGCSLNKEHEEELHEATIKWK